mgnify:FL=1
MRSDGAIRYKQLRKIIDRIDTRAKEDKIADSDCVADGVGEELGRSSDCCGKI